MQVKFLPVIETDMVVFVMQQMQFHLRKQSVVYCQFLSVYNYYLLPAVVSFKAALSSWAE